MVICEMVGGRLSLGEDLVRTVVFLCESIEWGGEWGEGFLCCLVRKVVSVVRCTHATLGGSEASPQEILKN